MSLQDFDRVKNSYNEQEAKLSKRKLELPSELSNPDSFLDFSLKICQNLRGLWLFSGFQQKVMLQKPIFPERVVINRETREFRTSRVNKCIELILSESMNCDDGNDGMLVEHHTLSVGAEREGFEPSVQLPAQRFSRPSHSATLAPLLKIYKTNK
jgi:hypothetical protein